MKTKNPLLIMAFLGIAIMALGLYGSATYADITRSPYLQPTDDMATSVGVAWRTANGGISTIYYGINDISENSASAEPVEAIEGTTTVYKYYIKLQSLTPGAIYKYKIEGDNDVEPEPGQGSGGNDYYEFKTSPPDGKFKLLVGSDWHFKENPPYWFLEYWNPLYSHMLAFDPDVVLLAGDNVDGGQRPADYDTLFRSAHKLFATAIVIPVRAGHDGYPKDFSEQFYLPENGPQNFRELTYSVEYGGAHFLIMDYSGSNNLTYKDWIDADLSSAMANGSNFTLVGRHVPIYGFSGHQGYSLTVPLTDFSQFLLQAFDKHGVDIDFTGHLHDSSRTFPIISNPFNNKQLGIVFTNEREYYNGYTKGTILNGIRPIVPHNHTAVPFLYTSSIYSGLSAGYTQVRFDGKRCAVYSYNYSPSKPTPLLEDSYVIDKVDITEPPIPAISNIRITEMGAYRAVIEWQSDIATRGQVEFGTSSGAYTYIDMRDDQNQIFTTMHKTILQCLTPGSTYYYHVKSWCAGKEAFSEEYSFTTPSTAAAGELVGEFDFGPVAFSPEGARVSFDNFDTRLRHGFLAGTNGSYYDYVNPSNGTASSTFCYRRNTAAPAVWRLELANGEYDIEITVGKGGVLFGDTRIDLENGQAVFEKQMPPVALDPGAIDDTNSTLWIWSTPLSINDSSLELKMGYGDTSHPSSTIINRLRIWARGHYPPGYESDITAPSRITDLAVSGATANSVTLTWTAPGDDKKIGQAASYDMKYGNNVSEHWYSSYATPAQGEPNPEPASAVQSFTVTGLYANKNYEFAIRTQDDAGNVSAISNVVNVKTSAPPVTLSVALSAEPSSAEAPLNEIALTATISGTADGPISYYFYPNRPDGELGTAGAVVKYENISETTKAAVIPSNYSVPRTYFAKVVVLMGALAAENRADIVVTTPSGLLQGDVNNDGRVDILDLVIVARAFGSSAGESNWDARADLNEDNTVDIMDLIIVARNFGSGA